MYRPLSVPFLIRTSGKESHSEAARLGVVRFPELLWEVMAVGEPEPTCAISPLTAGGASLTTNSASISSSSTNSGFDLAKFLDSFETDMDKVLMFKHVLGGDLNLGVVF